MNELEIEVSVSMKTIGRWLRGVLLVETDPERTRCSMDAGEHLEAWNVRVCLRLRRAR